MSAPMVRAVLADTKTQTRRIIKPQPKQTPKFGGFGRLWFDGQDEMRCPYGQRGDRLWVREAWQHANFPLGPYQDGTTVFYRADYMDDPHGPDGEKSPQGKYRIWKPSIHMPRTASRITLEITGVRVERLQDIIEGDAIAEGIERTGRHWKSYSGPGRFCRSPISSYQTLWESINGVGSWAANPWVWVILFKRV